MKFAKRIVVFVLVLCVLPKKQSAAQPANLEQGHNLPIIEVDISGEPRKLILSLGFDYRGVYLFSSFSNSIPRKIDVPKVTGEPVNVAGIRQFDCPAELEEFCDENEIVGIIGLQCLPNGRYEFDCKENIVKKADTSEMSAAEDWPLLITPSAGSAIATTIHDRTWTFALSSLSEHPYTVNETFYKLNYGKGGEVSSFLGKHFDTRRPGKPFKENTLNPFLCFPDCNLVFDTKHGKLFTLRKSQGIRPR